MRSSRWSKHGFLILCAFVAGGCERCFPGSVSDGVARLTVRNFGMLVDLVNGDETCGFESDAAVLELEGTPGEQGAAVWTITDCAITNPVDDPWLKTDCNEVTTTVSGKLLVTAKRRLEGYLTGDPKQPVIPNGPDAVSIEIVDALVEDFRVESSDSEDRMFNLSGRIGGVLRPRLAAAADTGVCSIPTRNISFEGIEYRDAEVRVIAKGRDFRVPVPTSNIRAVNGRVGEFENVVFGSLTVWDTPETLSEDLDDAELNPDYDSDVHSEGFACETNLALPVEYGECTTDVRPLVAQGASQLTVQLFGKVAEYLDLETRCGFSSDQVLDTVAIQGELGRRGGSGVWRIASPCTLEFPEATMISDDCNGKQTWAEGTVSITGTKTLRGIPSGDRLEPIVPTTRDPAQVELQLDFSDFSLWSGDGTQKLLAKSGALFGTINPRVAQDLETGACSVKTPVTHFEALTYDNATLVVAAEGLTFEVHADTSILEAQNGTKNGRTNYLAGTLVLDGESFEIPTGTEPILDPEFDEAEFEAGFACKPGINIPADDATCDMTQALGEGAARLVMMSLGAVAGLTNDDSDCGFSTIRLLLNPSELVGEPGDPGLMAWDIADCDIGPKGGAANEPYKVDCLGLRKFAGGVADVDANRRVTGIRENLIDIGPIELIDSIQPDTHNSVTLTFDAIRFSDFEVYEVESDKNVPEKGIAISSGTFAAVVEPITGENASKPGRYDVPTEIAFMHAVRVTNAPIEMLYQGKTFRLTIEDAQLEGFNGSYVGLGKTNELTGFIVVDGKRIDVPANAPLNPDFEQSDFDARYVCTEDLVATIEPQ